MGISMHILYKFFCKHTFSFLLDKYLGLEFLGHKVGIYLTFKVTAVFQNFCIILLLVEMCESSGTPYFFFFFFKLYNFYLFIYLFMAVLGLRFCARAFPSCGKWGPLFIAVRGPLIIAASLVAKHRLQTRRLSNCGSRA